MAEMADLLCDAGVEEMNCAVEVEETRGAAYGEKRFRVRVGEIVVAVRNGDVLLEFLFKKSAIHERGRKGDRVVRGECKFSAEDYVAEIGGFEGLGEGEAVR